MPNAIAFFPWVYTAEQVSVGPLRLLPYHRGKLPADLTNITQFDIAGVLGAYANRPGYPITQATILEMGDWRAGMPPTPEQISEIFRVRNMVAFSALSHRSLFRQSFRYCNYDTYSLVVQGFEPGKTRTFAFDTRRRDGRTSQTWSSDKFAFHRPNHVDGSARMALDHPLLSALLALAEKHEAFYESLVEFNSANTDSHVVPEHVEVVMCKSAFEWLLGIGERANHFVTALTERFEGVDVVPCDGPLKEKWRAKWPKASRPLYAWAKEFCAVRGGSAHGMSRDTTNFVWHTHQHLAFVAVFFPLLFKKVLSDNGLMAMDSYDLERLKRVDAYLTHDPFDFDWDGLESDHPWATIDTEALICAREKIFCPDEDSSN